MKLIEDTAKRIGVEPRKVFELCYERLGIARPQDEARIDWVKYRTSQEVEQEVLDFCLDIFEGKVKVLHGELV